MTNTQSQTGSVAASIAAHSCPWVPDQGDGTYANPILYADYSDPDVIRVGEDYYLTASSFNCTPGLPILHSKDLVNWTIIGHAIQHVPDPRYATVQPGCGVWAPAIRHHDGKFWIFFPTPDEGIYVTTAINAIGPWSEPHLLLGRKGLIDPCPLWDDDGQAYLAFAYAGSRAGIKNKIHIRPMTPDAKQIIGEGQIVYDNPEKHITLEGPKLYKRDGCYYILAPAGQVAAGWQVAFRSRNIYGPYEDRILLDQGDTPINGPHQGALLDSPDGKWWFVHFQEVQPYGRIVHLQPAEWKDGWPTMGEPSIEPGVGQPVPRHVKPRVSSPVKIAVPQMSDEFDSPTLGLQWQWQANYRNEWYSLSACPGHLRLFAQPVLPIEAIPNLLLQKFPARSFAMQTEIELSPSSGATRAGLFVASRTASTSLIVERIGSGWSIVLESAGRELTRRPIAAGPVRLQLRVLDGGHCCFDYAAGTDPLQSLVHRPLAREGHWIGAKFGLGCLGDTGTFADFDHSRVTKLTDAAPALRP